MKSILILTQYYPPETGAPQNRLKSLAINLRKLGMEVIVLTAMPNYPKMEIFADYKKKFYIREKKDDITIHRSWIYVKKSKGVIWRMLNYFSFVFSSTIIGLFKVKKATIIFCESPPLFLGITALIIGFFKGSKLVFNVSDLWPESAEKLGIIKNRKLLNLAQRLEELLYTKSALISGQTQGIVSNIKSRFPQKEIFWLRNGIDLSQFNDAALTYDWKRANNYNPNDFLILYGGVIGHAQNLEVILYAADILRENYAIKFVIVGDGPEKERLQLLKNELNLSNVTFFANQPSYEMPNIIYSSNVAVIPLRKLDLFKGAIPSKIFEALIYKKPILLGVDGEAKDIFINTGDCGLYYEPENHTDLAKAINIFYSNENFTKQKGLNGKSYIEKNFNRETVAVEFFQKIDVL